MVFSFSTNYFFHFQSQTNFFLFNCGLKQNIFPPLGIFPHGFYELLTFFAFVSRTIFLSAPSAEQTFFEKEKKNID